MSETQPHFSPADCEVGADCADGVRLDIWTQVSPASPAQVSPVRVAPAQNQRATEGAFSLARRRWQEGTVYLRSSKKLPDAWWGRFVETIENESGAQRVQRNIRLGDVRQFTKPLAKRALRDHVDKANNYQPQAMKVQMMGKAATPFSVFVGRWKEEVLIHKKASTASAI